MWCCQFIRENNWWHWVHQWSWVEWKLSSLRSHGRHDDVAIRLISSECRSRLGGNTVSVVRRGSGKRVWTRTSQITVQRYLALNFQRRKVEEFHWEWKSWTCYCERWFLSAKHWIDSCWFASRVTSVLVLYFYLQPELKHHFPPPNFALRLKWHWAPNFQCQTATAVSHIMAHFGTS